MIGRSLVIHGPDEAARRIACANITLLRFPLAQTGSWQGSGSSEGNIHFLQLSPQGPTHIHVSLTCLDDKAGGYHIHLLPIKSGLEACSNENVKGHFNPFGVNISTSPTPGNGTVDQYEIGDISGKFGSLVNQNQFENHYRDSNMPLSGPNSIIGRSLVIHYRNGSRMQCADITAVNSLDGQWIVAKAIFNGPVKGTVTLSQQCFPDGSFSDVTLLVDLIASSAVNVTKASWYITENPVNELVAECPKNGAIYNPFNMSAQSSNCSPLTYLACEVGDLTSKHGSVILTQRQLFTDAQLQLAGDYTVVYRALVLKAGNMILDCAAIIPVSPSAQQVFPSVTSFSRYDFRKRVAEVLGVQISRVSILPGALSTKAGGKCQQVRFLVSGDMSSKKLSAVKDSEMMGMYRQAEWCMKSGAPGFHPTHGETVHVLSLAAVYLLRFLTVHWTAQ
ncbi:Cell surface Cu-only superoxide dismutase 5 [Bagarius yarrelli]|uniref:Cell surface Cu-only superoxide dismutase 5 n=1 Tax=Bagarius yarrelli TaxID=175774 RepID=A0A556TTX2_BAGYA|nr:Cell surface Cu-only superoxide dismutase 5 [Bagarius yarrelli]